jgi:hypothetical protein
MAGGLINLHIQGVYDSQWGALFMVGAPECLLMISLQISVQKFTLKT